ncbi:hypothetical protein [Saccharothrix coeruleofusca]|uniref:Uncharacterized protein n=1 Tax=Saccharothrix coeruleofusca TaxID=33919 RepID=A0A918AT96_9PSEU|nr:hypothetical protein [Saccharothrix coeruleofusca]MBP2339713.1 hypothetical protein [Saccharothrix coeruleofusca]GGP80674.1 hypothetical protein GCM10010185_63200 [Saccharothrix coeruleofusca]
MFRIIAALLVVWLALTVLGALVKGVFWLVVVGGALFLGTAAYGALKSRSKT